MIISWSRISASLKTGGFDSMTLEITPSIVRAMRPDLSSAASVATRASQWRRELPEQVGMILRLAAEVSFATGETVEDVIRRAKAG